MCVKVCESTQSSQIRENTKATKTPLFGSPF